MFNTVFFKYSVGCVLLTELVFLSDLYLLSETGALCGTGREFFCVAAQVCGSPLISWYVATKDKINITHTRWKNRCTYVFCFKRCHLEIFKTEKVIHSSVSDRTTAIL